MQRSKRIVSVERGGYPSAHVHYTESVPLTGRTTRPALLLQINCQAIHSPTNEDVPMISAIRSSSERKPHYSATRAQTSNQIPARSISLQDFLNS